MFVCFYIGRNSDLNDNGSKSNKDSAYVPAAAVDFTPYRHASNHASGHPQLDAATHSGDQVSTHTNNHDNNIAHIPVAVPEATGE